MTNPLVNLLWFAIYDYANKKRIGYKWREEFIKKHNKLREEIRNSEDKRLEDCDHNVSREDVVNLINSFWDDKITSPTL